MSDLDSNTVYIASRETTNANFYINTVSPEQLERFGAIYIVGDDGELTVTTGPRLDAQRRGERARETSRIVEVDDEGEDDSTLKSVVEKIPAKNDHTARVAAGRVLKEKQDKEEKAKKEMEGLKAAMEKLVMQEEEKAEKAKARAVSRAEQAKKTKAARKTAAERRKNFGLV